MEYLRTYGEILQQAVLTRSVEREREREQYGALTHYHKPVLHPYSHVYFLLHIDL